MTRPPESVQSAQRTRRSRLRITLPSAGMIAGSLALLVVLTVSREEIWPWTDMGDYMGWVHCVREVDGPVAWNWRWQWQDDDEWNWVRVPS